MQRAASAPVTEDGDVQLVLSKKVSDNPESPSDPKNEKLYNLYIKAVSWPTEGRGLLHILSPLLYCKDFRIRCAFGSYFLARDEAQMWIYRNKDEIPQDQMLSARMDVSASGILLESNSSGSPTSHSELWEEVACDSYGSLVTAGNVVRFGSYKVKVVDMVLTSGGYSSLKPFMSAIDNADTHSEHASIVSETHSIGGPICRICFENSDGPENILISACSCAGSLRYIHVECLRRWLDGQLQVKQFDEGGGSYLIRTIACEICKSPYSKSVYESILIPRPKVPHIILEDFTVPPMPLSPNSSASQPTSKIHIIPITALKPIKIGRSKDNDIVLADISVSRMHAMMTLTPEGVRVVDLNSKFGSLIQLPPKIYHTFPSASLRVQIGSSLVEVSPSLPSRIERMLPDRFLQERGVVRMIKSKAPNERNLEAERMRRNPESPSANPLSPAATLNDSYLRSPGVLRDEDVVDDLVNQPGIRQNGLLLPFNADENDVLPASRSS